MAASVLILILGGVAFAFYYAATSSRMTSLEQSVSSIASFESTVSELESQLSSAASQTPSASPNQTALLQSGIVPSAPCFNYNMGSQSVSCSLMVSPSEGVIVVSQAVPPMTIHDSANSSFQLLANATHTYTTYRFLAYYAQVWNTGQTGNVDTITVDGIGNNLMMSAVALSGVSKLDNVSYASGNSSTPNVPEYTPPKNAFVYSVMFAPYWLTVSAGQGYALIGQYAGVMADEYGTATASTTSPFEVTSGWHDNATISSGWSDFQQWAVISVAVSCVSMCHSGNQSSYHP